MSRSKTTLRDQSSANNMSQPFYEPLAIVGLACRLPGGIETPAELWSLLSEGRDALGPIFHNRYNSKSFDEHLLHSYSSTAPPIGYFLDHDLEKFDPECFSLNRTEAAQLDPVQRQLLEITQECLDSAGANASDTAGHRTGCFVGTFGEDWQDLRRKDTLDHGPYRLIGASDFAASNRISFEYDFRGPSVTYRTACSASLVALHSACQALQLRDCDAALIATANLIFSPTNTSGLADLGALASDGSSKTFDTAASGYARAEAVSALYVRRLDDALLNGDSIRAIIRATTSNSDGRSSAFSNPNPQAHAELMRSAYALSGLSPHDTAFVEMHGTGTAVGDPLEAQAVAEVFGRSSRLPSVYIGSVKPNVGHSEGASGLTSVIKAILALEHEVIPPNIKFNMPNPRIPFTDAGLIVPDEPTPWPAGKAKRVSVNSFGLGGSNAHVILESFRQTHHISHSSRCTRKGAHMAVFSAFRPDSVRRMIDRTASYVASNPESESDIAHTLNNRRCHRRQRAFAIYRDGQFKYTHAPAETLDRPRTVFVFTGQGAQTLGMGAELAERYPSFDADLVKMDQILQMTSSSPDWSLREMVRDKCGHVDKIPGVISQPLCIAVQIALVNLLQLWGVRPDAVVGHSSGEIVAAYVSGALTMEEATITAFWRGQSLISNHSSGSMAAVELSEDDVAPYLEAGVGVACVNSPSNVTLSGDKAALNAVVAKIKRDRPTTFARTLGVDHAYHSAHMKTIADTYLSLMGSSIAPRKRKVEFYSTVYGRALKPTEDIDAVYWLKNIVQPVLFAPAVAAILRSCRRPTTFVEIGPHSALRGPLRQCIQKAAQVDNTFYIPTLVRHEDSQECLLKTVGSLFSLGIYVDLAAVTPKARVLHDLPSYQWQREHLWHESRISRQWRMRPHARHELLGVPILENNELEPTWRNILRIRDVAWLSDHQIDSNTVFPGAAYIAMMGEAMRQLHGDTGGKEAYTVKNVTIKNALVCHESQPVEVLSSLKPYSWSKNQPSSWYDFTISSFQNSRWTQHCTGQVRSGFSGQENSCSEQYPRRVDAPRVYRTLARCGLQYGPCFARLCDITCSVREKRAVATIAAMPPGAASEKAQYAIHPTDIDTMFQALMVANVNGHPRLLNGIYVPTSIAEMTIRRHAEASDTLQVHARLDGGQEHNVNRQALRGSFVARADEAGTEGVTLEPALEARGVALSLVEKLEETTPFETNNSGAELTYRPSLRFMTEEQRAALFKPEKDISALQDTLEKLMLHLLHLKAPLLRQTQPRTTYLEKYRDWLLNVVECISPTFPAVQDNSLRQMGYNSVEALLQQLQNERDDLGLSAATAVKLIGENLIDIIEGRTASLELLIQDDVLNKYYQLAERFDYKDFISALIHENPTCRILEIGAGTGGTTAKILPYLQPKSSARPMCAEYTFTDVSEGFLMAAKERFAGSICADILTFQTFDITQDPRGRGVALGQYDLIIATNVVHATASLHESLVNIRQALKPGGSLLLQELCSEKNFTSFIMGGFEGWWSGSDDGRATRPYVSPKRWDAELKAAGLSSSAIFDHGQEEYRFCAMIASRLQEDIPATMSNGIPEVRRSQVTLVVSQNNDECATWRILSALESGGFAADISVIGCGPQPPASSDFVVSLVDLDKSLTASSWTSTTGAATGDRFQARKALIDGLHAHQRLLWVIPSPYSTSWTPQHCMVYGLARTLRLERSLDFSTLEIDTPISVLEDYLPAFLHEHARFDHLTVNSKGLLEDTDDSPKRTSAQDLQDYEYRLTSRGVEVGRYQWYSIPKALSSEAQHSRPDQGTIARLEITQPGVLSTLRWQKAPISPEIAAGDIRLQVKAVGMNFRDVLTAMGVISSPSLGIEATGVVVEVGASVTDLHAGDHVAVLTEGAFATELVVSRSRCTRIPNDLSFEQAATLYSVFCTNMLALNYVARMKRGMTILIHSACGGIGLSAIQLCQNVGVEIFATVGSMQKSEYLQTKFRIRADHVFNSRDKSFQNDLLKATAGKGVDIVLNSLSGELLDASWDCVADFGMMLELGKRDMQDGGSLRMANFASNRSYHGVDLAHVIAERPELCASLMADVSDLLCKGLIEPIAPVKTFDAQDIEQCFRFFQKGEHMGKVVVALGPEFAADNSQPSAVPSISFDMNAGYLLVGGLGGLGQAVSIWMAERGARHFVYISRSGHSTKTDAFFEELEAFGCTYEVHKGSVIDLDLVTCAVRTAKKPVRGILQMAMQLQDANFTIMSDDEWAAVTAPKVEGTMNLHAASLEQNRPLDFFVMFSSQNGTHGWHGQGNYAAANTFLDAFLHYRRTRGLAASVLDIGPVEDIGFVSERRDVQSKMGSIFRFLPEQEFLRALELAIVRSVPSRHDRGSPSMAQIIPGLHPSLKSPGAASEVVAPWARDARFLAYRALERAERSTNRTNSNSMVQNQPPPGPSSSGKRAAALTAFLSARSSTDEPSSITSDRQVSQIVSSAILERLCMTTGMDPAPFFGTSQEITKKNDIEGIKIQDVGMDSLIAIEFQGWWRQTFRSKISVIEIMDLGTIGSLTNQALKLIASVRGE